MNDLFPQSQETFAEHSANENILRSWGIVPPAHYITSFQNSLKAFTSSFLQGGSSQDVINNFIKTMKDKYGVTVTVQQ
jgi:hypothetical protein